MHVTLEKEEFRSWLAGQEPCAIVGQTRSSVRCPIARFLRERIDPALRVTPTVLIVPDGANVREFLMPDWARAFVVCVDSSDKGEISALDAIKLLDIETI